MIDLMMDKQLLTYFLHGLERIVWYSKAESVFLIETLSQHLKIHSQIADVKPVKLFLV